RLPRHRFRREIRHLPDHVVAGNLPDADYEKALGIIGSVAAKYGFTPQPQRLHDAPGSHDAVFHNVHDAGEISSGTALNTSFGVSLGCHLMAEAKKRGHPSSTPTPRHTRRGCAFPRRRSKLSGSAGAVQARA